MSANHGALFPLFFKDLGVFCQASSKMKLSFAIFFVLIKLANKLSSILTYQHAFTVS